MSQKRNLKFKSTFFLVIPTSSVQDRDTWLVFPKSSRWSRRWSRKWSRKILTLSVLSSKSRLVEVQFSSIDP
jgi:hypothetical protein